jgi:hypothetical protein
LNDFINRSTAGNYWPLQASVFDLWSFHILPIFILAIALGKKAPIQHGSVSKWNETTPLYISTKPSPKKPSYQMKAINIHSSDFQERHPRCHF